ncbi:MAG: hypothetical protein MUF80_11720 [Burkholderiales bacterium]|nr:hypothetical protein [Burkholderiales bacterium]
MNQAVHCGECHDLVGKYLVEDEQVVLVELGDGGLEFATAEKHYIRSSRQLALLAAQRALEVVRRGGAAADRDRDGCRQPELQEPW